jgi:hypothetical protein
MTWLIILAALAVFLLARISDDIRGIRKKQQ